MTRQDRSYFTALSKDRADSAKILEKPSMRGVKNSVVEKYSDQAHFIYELIQNADDAHATSARFVLEQNRLLFAHNGSRHFSVTNPGNEEEDSKAGTLGDINAITSIANSNKTEASIGKFGVGFKAVFQYTTTPHIYDPGFRFKIERFIVPVLLNSDTVERKKNETMFVFPFDHPERNPVESYDDISNKLRNLSFPLLFLSELKSIEFIFGDVIGCYSKNSLKTYTFDDVTAELICLTQNDGKKTNDHQVWLFSRTDKDGFKCSIGYFVNKKGDLIPIDEPAFCFFPTKESTRLNFIIHAPFLLTDSREGIRAGIQHNDTMIQNLADLAARALVLFKDIGAQESRRIINEDILKIIPYDRSVFGDPKDKRRVSFLPFYYSIKRAFRSEEILPSDKDYTTSSNAYWAAASQLPQLFSNQQLSLLANNKQAKWVFPSLGRDEVYRNNKTLCIYIDSIVRTNINEDVLLLGRSDRRHYSRWTNTIESSEKVLGITPEFIEAQSILWLNKFYKWLSETKHRREAIIKVPVFLDQNEKAVAAYDKGGHAILFLPVKNVSGYRVVHSKLLKNPDTRAFVKEVGIKQPSLKDQIYNKILPLYESNSKIDVDTHFGIFFQYYRDKCLSGEDEDFIQLIKGYEFLTYTSNNSEVIQRGAASTMYLPSPELTRYFETKPDTRFVTLEKYKALVGRSKTKQLLSFLADLGVQNKIKILSVPINFAASKRRDLPTPASTRDITWNETVVDGLKEIIEHITINKDKNKSLLLWNSLLSIIETQCTGNQSLSDHITGTCDYFFKRKESTTFASSDEIRLKNEPWLVNRRGKFVTVAQIDRESLLKRYDVSSKNAIVLLDYLGIQDKAKEQAIRAQLSYLTDSQRENIEFAEKIKAMGIDESDLEELRRIKRRRESKRRLADRENDDESENIRLPVWDKRNNRRLNKRTSAVVEDIISQTSDSPALSDQNQISVEEDWDQDEYTPTPVDYGKRIERAKQKSAAEIDRIAYIENLQEKALSLAKYSYGWFKVLLEMEALSSGESYSGNRVVSISFSKVEREPGTNRTLVLKHPNRYIPQFMEDLTDIPLVLHIGNKTKTLVIEVANVISYTLRVKLKSGANIDNIDFHEVNEATIDAQSPVFLLEELRKEFAALSFSDDYNLQDNLCENIEFVFGPPGTGKTTYLAKNVLLPIMEDNKRVLVLTPTNKASDVLVRRIMEVSGDKSNYEKWLVRFGTTADEAIEQSPVYRDKTFDIRKLSKSVTITTIARFPYDFFMSSNARIFLREMNWDYIVIDEASMIPLANIIYPLYKKTPQKFIIAGDPFQIEPITYIDLWKDENIYSLVHLDSFVEPKTTPYQYKVELLTTQYRSIPEIGEIFSRFAYGGILNHYRSSCSQKKLHLEGSNEISTLNIVKYPVSKYESIYRAKRLQHSSPYQIYSALFTYEYVCHLSKTIAENNPDELIKIGIIAPYRAQADLIDKLLASEQLPSSIDVQVGTIHGFQGDECDIIFAVYNPPQKITLSDQMFLNKRNIINVSISRARDYLFVIMPDDNTENVRNLRLIKRIEKLIKSTDVWTEFLSPDLEEEMFGDSNYLENNVFSTGHQSVNVYGLPEKRYEVRTEDNAVDIQIHRKANLPL